MATADNRRRVEALEERVAELEAQQREHDIALLLPWPLRLIGRWFDE